jgi:hypothetical protein
MLNHYLAKRDNPWELLVIGGLLFFPGLTLLLQYGPVLLLSASKIAFRPTWMSEGVAHVFGATAMLIGAIFVPLYFFVRYIGKSQRERLLAERDPHKDELPLVYGSTRSPVPVFERLKFWRSRSS